MQLICLNILLGILLVIVSHVAEAQIRIGTPFSKNSRKECAEFRQIKLNPQLQKEISRALSLKNKCASAEILFNVAFVSSGTGDFKDFTLHGPRSNFQGNSLHELNQRKLVESLYSSKDTVGTINQANVYLDIYPNTKFSRSMHYYLVLAQNMRIRPVGNDQSDTYIALGMDADQIRLHTEANLIQLSNGMEISLGVQEIYNPNFNEHQYRRSFPSFLKKWGRRPAKDTQQIMKLFDVAAVQSQEKELDVGLYYYERKNYMAAISRFKQVTNAGPVTGLSDGAEIWKVWDESAYFTALSFVEMGKAILGQRTYTQYLNARQVQESIESIVWHLNRRSVTISNPQIGAWLRMNPSEYTPGQNGHPSRMELARVSFQNAGMILRELESERRNGGFDKKLRQSLTKKVSSELKSSVPDIESLLNL